MEEIKSGLKETSLEEMTLEQGLQQIEEILDAMEGEDVSLEDSFTLYRQGMERLKRCNELIEGVEQKVMMINKEGNLQEFQEE